MNIRAIQAIIDDANPATSDLWDYPGGDGSNDLWDGWEGQPGSGAARNTAEFIAQIPTYRSFGTDMVTIGLQGGSPRFRCADPDRSNRTFSLYDDATDDLLPSAKSRLESVIAAAWDVRMIVSVQLFYQNQDQREPNTDAEIVATMRNTVAFLKELATADHGAAAPAGYQNIVIEIGNEISNNDAYGAGPTGSTALDPSNLATRIQEIHAEWPGAIVTVNLGNHYVSSSLTADANDALQVEEDWLSIHANGSSATTMANRIRAARSDAQSAGKPVVVTEDRWSLEGDQAADDMAPHDDGRAINPNLDAAVAAGGGWGYYEQGCENGSGSAEQYDDVDPGEPGENYYNNGFQSPPVNWSPFSGEGAKLDFFTDVSEVTGGGPSPSPFPSPSPSPSPSASPSPSL